MKRLLITMEYPPDVGGVAEYYAGLVEALPAGSVTVMTPRTHRFYLSWIWPHWLPLLWNAWCIIRRVKPDEVWAGQILPIGTAIWILKSFTFHVSRFTIFCHGTDIIRCQHSRWKIWLAQRILRAASKVVVNSSFLKKEIENLGIPNAKISIVYPCPRISDQVSRVRIQELRDQYQLHGKKVLLTVARLVQSKGIDVVIEAFRDVIKRIPNLIYVIVGDGPERDHLKLQIENPKLPVILVGAITDTAERAAWFSIADIFILTPRFESFGLVYLEANLFNKPVIGSQIGGISEAIMDGEEQASEIQSKNAKQMSSVLSK